MRSLLWPTSSSDGARRSPQPAPSETCWRIVRVSEKPDAGRWQPAQATFAVSPSLPSAFGPPSLSPVRSSPENPGSKNKRWPKRAAAGKSAIRLLLSLGGGGDSSNESAASAACSGVSAAGGPPAPLPALHARSTEAASNQSEFDE